MRAQFDGVDRVHVVFDGYCEATVILAENYGDSPIAESRPLAHSAPSALPARALYTDRWMFHGPSYQGVVALDAIGDEVRGDFSGFLLRTTKWQSSLITVRAPHSADRATVTDERYEPGCRANAYPAGHRMIST